MKFHAQKPTPSQARVVQTELGKPERPDGR